MQINTFKSEFGCNLQTYIWKPKNPNGVGLYLVHGYAEHCGRYKHVAKYFTDEGFTVYGIDHYGHGQSEGKRALITNIEFIVLDIKNWIESEKKSNAKIDRHFVLGHSMGGLLTSFLVKSFPELVDGFMLSAPLIYSANVPPKIIIRIGEFLSKFLPNLPIVPFNGEDISRDKAVVKAFLDDEFTYKGKLKIGTGAELHKRGGEILQIADKIVHPCWVGHSSTDRITDFEASKKFFDLLGSVDKTFQKYDGLSHELLNEPEKRVVMGQMLTWLKKRANIKPQAELPEVKSLDSEK